MKKVFAITLIMLCHFVFSANAQPGLNIAQQHRAYIDSLLATVGIGKQTIPTGILYDRAIAIASLQKHDHSKRVNKNMFMQAALEIRNAAYDTLQHPSNSAIRSIAEHYTYRRNIAPIGVSFNRMTYIDTLAVEKGLIIIDGQGRPRPTGRLKTEGLQQMDMLMAAILWDGNELEMQQSFILPTELIMGNRKAEFETVEINFDDGQGFRSVTFNTPVDVSYSTHGSKTMVLKATTSEGEEFSSFSKFDVKDSTPIVWSAYGIIEEIHRQDTIYADISFAGSNGNFQGMGLVTYLHRHADKKLRKPVLIVDGFDPGNNNKDDNIFFTYLNNEDTGFLFADSLHAAGYDLVILDFPKAWNELVYNPPYPCYVPGHGWDTCGDTWGKIIDAGADYIQRNSYVAVKVIETLNQQLQQNGSNEELVVIGPSMGGLITRYALRYMELQPSLNHNTRLWVSFDSPHKGANIPIGLQHYIDYFAQAEINDAVVARKLFLQNPAAKQMLIHHYLSNSETPVGAPGYHTNWYNEINSMGFPQQLRRVAISNGSINGTNEATPGSKAVGMVAMGYFLGNFTWMAEADIYNTGSYNSRTKVFWGNTRRLNDEENNYARGLSGSYSLDNSPGGIRNTYSMLPELVSSSNYLFFWSIHQPSHSFIPTKSALAFSGSSPDLRENIGNRNLVATSETPFHSYWGPINKNMGHIEFDANLMCWVLNEINGIPMPPSITSTITGPTTVCSSWVTFTLNNVPEGLTVSWDVSSNLTTSTSCNPAPGRACIRVRASGVFNGSGFVRATVSGPCGDVMVPSYPVWVGTVTPLTGIIGFPYNGMEFGSNSVYNFSVYPPPAQGVNYTEWTVGGGTITQGQGSQQVSVLTGTGSDETPLYFNLNVRVGNTCGLSPWFMRTGYVVGGTGAITSFSVYPNPTTGMVTIAALEDETNTMTASNHANEIHSVKIFDKMGMAVGSFNFSGQESHVNVNVSSLPKGVYLILINEKDRLTMIKE